MASLRSHLAAWGVRKFLRPGLDATRPAEAVRRHVERFQSLGSVAKDITCEEVRLGSRPGMLYTPPNAASKRAILYLHGGAYAFGSPNTHRLVTSNLARAAAALVFSLDYRLAPENPAPAALEDAIQAYRQLAKRFGDKNIIVAGDSAGAGLALALLFTLRDEGAEQPAGGLLFCPWGDLELTGESIKRNRDLEPTLKRENLALCAEYYAADMDLSDPLLSPIHGNYADLAPLYIQAAGKDLLLDDARLISQAARKAGNAIKIDVFADMFHAFQVAPHLVPEGQKAIVLAGAWAKTQFD